MRVLHVDGDRRKIMVAIRHDGYTELLCVDMADKALNFYQLMLAMSDSDIEIYDDKILTVDDLPRSIFP